MAGVQACIEDCIRGHQGAALPAQAVAVEDAERGSSAAGGIGSKGVGAAASCWGAGARGRAKRGKGEGSDGGGGLGAGQGEGGGVVAPGAGSAGGAIPAHIQLHHLGVAELSVLVLLAHSSPCTRGHCGSVVVQCPHEVHDAAILCQLLPLLHSKPGASWGAGREGEHQAPLELPAKVIDSVRGGEGVGGDRQQALHHLQGQRGLGSQLAREGTGWRQRLPAAAVKAQRAPAHWLQAQVPVLLGPIEPLRLCAAGGRHEGSGIPHTPVAALRVCAKHKGLPAILALKVHAHLQLHVRGVWAWGIEALQSEGGTPTSCTLRQCHCSSDVKHVIAKDWRAGGGAWHGARVHWAAHARAPRAQASQRAFHVEPVGAQQLAILAVPQAALGLGSDKGIGSSHAAAPRGQAQLAPHKGQLRAAVGVPHWLNASSPASGREHGDQAGIEGPGHCGARGRGSHAHAPQEGRALPQRWRAVRVGERPGWGQGARVIEQCTSAR